MDPAAAIKMERAINARQYEVGKFEHFHEWSPVEGPDTKWLLLSGANDPATRVTPRKTRDRAGFLQGVAKDMANMKRELGPLHFAHNTVEDVNMTKASALGLIRRLVEECRREETHPVLYYTGHGETGSGDWCFTDGTVSVNDIIGIVGQGRMLIISDACYSGSWADTCQRLQYKMHQESINPG